MRRITKSTITSIFLLLSLISAHALPSNSPNTRSQDAVTTKRLADLCRVWGSVKYFHPALAYRNDIDWDAALIKTIPKVREAQTAADYEAALQGMLEVLRDPSTRVFKTPGNNDQPAAPENMSVEKIQTDTGNIVVIKTGIYASMLSQENRKKVSDLLAEAPNARAFVFDLRVSFPQGRYGNNSLVEAFSGLERFLTTSTLSSPSERKRVHYGYEPQAGVSSGGYYSSFSTIDGKSVRPISNAKDVPAVFLINKNSGFLVSTLGKQAAGKGLVVFDGEDPVLSLTTTEFPVADGLTFRIRHSELINPDGTDGEPRPDALIPGSTDKADKALEKAVELAKNFKPSTVVSKRLPGSSSPMREHTYPDMKYPSLEYRLLAAFRIWNVFNHFFPYKNLMEKNWDEVLTDFVPRFEQAKDSREYALAVTEMLTYTNDSHVRAGAGAVRETFGASSIPVQLRMVEGSPTVFRYVNEQAARASGFELGDVILKIDGEDAKTRLAWCAKYTTGSNESSRMFFAVNTFTRGEENSIAVLTVRTKTGEEKEIKVPRKGEFTFQGTERTSDIYKLLSPDIGYADLDRLTVPMLGEVMEKFKDTKAIVFDMRGYPNGIAWSLPQLLTEKTGGAAAFFERPIVSFNNGSSESFYQPILPRRNNQAVYKGKTVMLIDERTISQSEHTGLFLRAANGTKFIGSQTAGANGDVTNFYIPGGIIVSFTGQSVKFPDGKQLQRIGLVPDIEVKPTIKGVQERKDEVLEKAISHLRTELGLDK
jgi:C-terminal processing protease CtpA/Prc